MAAGKKNHHLLSNEDGTTGVLFGLLAVPMLALVGTAVDVARVVKTRDAVQTAMDSAMLAAGKVAAAQQPAVAATFFQSNAAHVPKVKVAFTVGADGNLNGQATATVQTPFAGLMGKPAMSVTVKAKTRPQTTTLVNTERVPCIHAMDQSGSRTLWLDSNSALNATSCDVRVRSNASDGVYENASSDVKFGMVRVKGASAVTSGYSPATFSIVNEPYRVKEGEAIVADPYSRFVDEVRSQITVGNCTASNTNKTVSNNATPGTYCGATEFKNVTFAPGLYIIASQGSTAGKLKLSGLINGSAGVSFYFADSKAQLASYNADQGSSLSAPSSGLTKGLLFFDSSNRGGVYTVAVSSCKTHSWKGLIYMPGTNFAFEGLDAWPLFNIAISANQVKLKSLTSMSLQGFSWVPYGYSDPVMWPGDPTSKVSDAAVIE